MKTRYPLKLCANGCGVPPAPLGTRAASDRMGAGLPAQKELDIERGIMQYLAIRHIPAIQTHGFHYLPGGGVRVIRPHRKGVPDIIGCLPQSGRMFQVEVKGEDGIVSADQEAVMREFHQAGALVFIARSVQDVADQIDAASRK